VKFKEHKLNSIAAAVSVLAALLLLVVLSPEAALAQCPMCKLSAASSGAEAAKSLNLGILVLLVPPVTIFCSIFVIAIKHRKSARDEDGGGESSEFPNYGRRN
jgi:hypothetical protein